MENQSIADLKAIYDYCFLKLKRDSELNDLTYQAKHYYESLFKETNDNIIKKLHEKDTIIGYAGAEFE